MNAEARRSQGKERDWNHRLRRFRRLNSSVFNLRNLRNLRFQIFCWENKTIVMRKPLTRAGRPWYVGA